MIIQTFIQNNDQEIPKHQLHTQLLLFCGHVPLVSQPSYINPNDTSTKDCIQLAMERTNEVLCTFAAVMPPWISTLFLTLQEKEERRSAYLSNDATEQKCEQNRSLHTIRLDSLTIGEFSLCHQLCKREYSFKLSSFTSLPTTEDCL